MKPGPLSHALVAVQIAGIVLCCYPIGLTNRGAAWWLALCLAGTIAGVWALLHNRIGNFGVYPEPKPHAVLVTSGPYRWVRHPMYAALMLMMLGITGYNGHASNLIGLALVVAALAGKAVREERLLAATFPQYEEYARTKHRFIPFVY